MIRKLTFASIMFGAFLITGCDDKMPPKCDSKETKQLLNKLVVDQLKQLGMNNITTSITGYEMIEKYKKAKEYTCKARLVMDTNGKINSEIIEYSVFLDENQKGHFFIQLNDD